MKVTMAALKGTLFDYEGPYSKRRTRRLIKKRRLQVKRIRSMIDAQKY